ncbi:DUF7940 domain-containing protein [Methylobacterium sp. Leaf112]|uniref:DUF7940 domain-containing protein n=1 Tax=Methylobacterium sp. Leaf112 TaxID=1736258 RepID=UPI000AF97A64|nr:hypothetical protein [Methylobacterium sp. Leaf112]
MNFRLVENIECVLKHAWSVRFLALATVLDAAQASVSYFAGSELVSAPTLALANMALTMSAFAARCVAQEKVSGTGTGGEA